MKLSLFDRGENGDLYETCKLSKGAKVRNQYSQVPPFSPLPNSASFVKLACVLWCDIISTSLLINIVGSRIYLNVGSKFDLTLKAPITTAADDKFWDIFPNFRQK